MDSTANFCSGFPLLSLVDFFQCTFIAGFRNNFQDQRRVTEQLLETQAALRKPEHALWRGLLKGISQLVSDSYKQAENLIWILLHKKDIMKSLKP
jgi:hypothetical protein